MADYRKAYWQANLVLIFALLGVWFLTSIVFSILLVEPLNAIQLGGIPFGFWMAQQGSIYIFVALVFVYAIRMDKLDQKYGGTIQPQNSAPESDKEVSNILQK
ncbi:MAG: DUF4212 domain-containing protein [Cyanobacteria bacterium P01_A01_bin.135]